jgi:gamma-glutamylcyclotransferase (GGCT)/AIG2-like uncharacterized protein YtfP
MRVENQYLFVYGTLLDEKNEFGNYLKNNCVFFQNGSFNGRLYDIGDYPGAVYDPDTDDFVTGSVFVMNDPETTLKILDDYEGFGEDQPQPNEFIRTLIVINTAEGGIKSWVYLYNFSVEDKERIISGRYI